MKFNPAKPNIVCIGKKPHTTPLKWTRGDSIIHLSKDTNILGVTFNSQLNSMDHTKNRNKKISARYVQAGFIWNVLHRP